MVVETIAKNVKDGLIAQTILVRWLYIMITGKRKMLATAINFANAEVNFGLSHPFRFNCSQEEIAVDYEELAGVCGCGKVLFVQHDVAGKRIGVTHTPEDDDYHMDYWINYPMKDKGK